MTGKYALIIGNTEYIDPGLAQLTAPGKDAEDFARILKDKDLCAFDEVRVLFNQVASSVIESIDEFFGARHIGEVQAWNVDTGKRVWTHTFEKSANWGPILTTGGGLVFSGGTNDRMFRAFDAKNGKLLWEHPTNSGIIGVPVTYTIDGKQFVAVQSGWGIDARAMQGRLNRQFPGEYPEVPEGGAIWVFAVK